MREDGVQRRPLERSGERRDVTGRWVALVLDGLDVFMVISKWGFGHFLMKREAPHF